MTFDEIVLELAKYNMSLSRQQLTLLRRVCKNDASGEFLRQAGCYNLPHISKKINDKFAYANIPFRVKKRVEKKWGLVKGE